MLIILTPSLKSINNVLTRRRYDEHVIEQFSLILQARDILLRKNMISRMIIATQIKLYFPLL